MSYVLILFVAMNNGDYYNELVSHSRFSDKQECEYIAHQLNERYEANESKFYYCSPVAK
ncbi:MAG TPA: hypothetical protein VIG45_02795 [Erysipelothrix sp.]